MTFQLPLVSTEGRTLIMRCRHAAVCLSLLNACVSSPAVPPEEDERLLAAQLSDIEALFVPGQSFESVLDGYLGFFAEGSVLLPPDGPEVSGLAAIERFYADGFAGLAPVSLEYTEPDVLVSGDLAARRYDGTAVAVVSSTSDTLRFSTRYLDVVRRAEGEWRIVWHSWRSLE